MCLLRKITYGEFSEFVWEKKLHIIYTAWSPVNGLGLSDDTIKSFSKKIWTKGTIFLVKYVDCQKRNYYKSHNFIFICMILQHWHYYNSFLPQYTIILYWQEDYILQGKDSLLP